MAADFRAIALTLPEAVELETWGHPTFRIRKKMFASMATDGSTGTVKAVPEEQQACLKSEPDTFFFPKYVGKSGWIGINLDRIDEDELTELLTEAWRLTAPKKLLRAFDEAHPVPGPE